MAFVPHIIQRAGGNTPYVYEVSEDNGVTPYTISALFDGTGAAGPFLACVSFYAQNGALLSRVFPVQQVQAGDVAEVTYAPFLREDVGGAGIQYDVDNSGDWLTIETTGSEPGNGAFNLTLSGATADWNVDIGRDLNENIGDDYNLAMDRDFNISPGRDVNIEGGNDFNLGTLRDFNVTANHSVNLLGRATDTAAVSIAARGNDFEVQPATGFMFFVWNSPPVFGSFRAFEVHDRTVDSDTVVMRLEAGKKVNVVDASDAPIFQVHADGSIHGRAAVGAITWDL